MDDAFSTPRTSSSSLRNVLELEVVDIQNARATLPICIKAARGPFLTRKDSGPRMSTSSVRFLLLVPPSALLSSPFLADRLLSTVTPSDSLRGTLESALALVSPPPRSADDSDSDSDLSSLASTVHSLLPSASPSPSPSEVGAQAPLHLSLSRPLILQTNQRDELRTGVAKLASESSRYVTSLPRLLWLHH